MPNRSQASRSPPIGRTEDSGHRGNRRSLFDLGLHPNPNVLSQAKQVVDDVEAWLATGIIHPADVHQLLELEIYVIAQEGQDLYDRIRFHREHKLAECNLAFLFPWAISLGHIGVFGFWSMMIFLAILTIGFVYEWKKGALEWE